MNDSASNGAAMNNGVQRFEQAFAGYVGAKFAIAMCNGTATLHTALVVLGVEPESTVYHPDDYKKTRVENTSTPVAVPPITMASTTIAVLHAGGVPVFVDVDPDTWLMGDGPDRGVEIPVSLYGLHLQRTPTLYIASIDDAAQTLRPHGSAAFTSYSFQASKILPLGEGGMLVTDDPELEMPARDFASLGYLMDGPRIEPEHLKRPDFERHHTLGWNYRMADAVAEKAMWHFTPIIRGDAGSIGSESVPGLLKLREIAAAKYREAMDGCPWITPQHVPDGWTHDYWCYAVALESAELWHPFVEAIERHGGERPYACWRITYQEPAFRHLAEDGTCPVAEDLQPRLVQMQTNSIEAARTNADAVALAIKELNGTR